MAVVNEIYFARMGGIPTLAGNIDLNAPLDDYCLPICKSILLWHVQNAMDISWHIDNAEAVEIRNVDIVGWELR